MLSPGWVGSLGALSSLLAACSPLWNNHFGRSGYWVPLAVNVIGAVGAVVSAERRVRLLEVTHELTGAEDRLQAILRNLDEAVTVQDRAGRTIFANAAAATLVGFDTPEEMLAAPPGSIMQRFEVSEEDGTPVALEELPSFRIINGGGAADPMLVRNVVTATGAERWLIHRATPVTDDAGRLAFVVNVIEDVTEAKRAERGAHVLAEAGRVLASSLELEPMLDQVARLAVPELADWCGIDMAGDRGVVEPVAIAHIDPAREELGWELRRRYPVAANGDEGLPAVLREGTSWLMPAVAETDLVGYASDPDHLRLLRELGFGSVLVVPMLAGPRVIGALTFVSAREHRFDAADVALVEELGRRAGTAVHNARLYRERAEIAHTLQSSLLPAALPTMPRWRTASLYRPNGEANEVGGDFYDVFPLASGWALVVGDVAGKGPRAAAVTGMARHTLRTATRLAGRLAPAFAELNGALMGEPDLSLCTMAAIRVADNWMRVLSAGHPLPVLVRDGEVRRVGETGPLLGAYADVEWPVTGIDLRPGDAIVLFTDGVLDAVAEHGDRFGEGRLLETLAAATPTADGLVTAVGRALDRFAATGQRDDVAVLAVVWQGVLERHEELARAESSPAAARRAISTALEGSLPRETLERVLVLTSELVTNAVRHGGDGPIGLTARMGTVGLRVEVRDGGYGFVPPRPNPGPHGGFGLRLVDEAADRWGVEATGGTRVWFEIDFAMVTP